MLYEVITLGLVHHYHDQGADDIEGGDHDNQGQDDEHHHLFELQRGEEVPVALHPVLRITSYNVCYTKLLREERFVDRHVLDADDADPRLPLQDPVQKQEGIPVRQGVHDLPDIRNNFV